MTRPIFIAGNFIGLDRPLVLPTLASLTKSSKNGFSGETEGEKGGEEGECEGKQERERREGERGRRQRGREVGREQGREGRKQKLSAPELL